MRGILNLLAGERLAPRLPWSLIVVILSIVLMSVTALADQGIKIVSSSLVGGSAGWTAATERLAATGGLLVNSTGNFGGADFFGHALDMMQ